MSIPAPAAAPTQPLPSRCSSCEYAATLLPPALLLQPLPPSSKLPVSLLLLPLLR
jgi:hypothetical protein